MPRSPRVAVGKQIYHVMNRGNGRLSIFDDEEDFEAFERVLLEGLERYPGPEKGPEKGTTPFFDDRR